MSDVKERLRALGQHWAQQTYEVSKTWSQEETDAKTASMRDHLVHSILRSADEYFPNAPDGFEDEVVTLIVRAFDQEIDALRWTACGGGRA